MNEYPYLIEEVFVPLPPGLSDAEGAIPTWCPTREHGWQEKPPATWLLRSYTDYAFLKSCLERGMSQQECVQALLAHGWEEQKAKVPVIHRATPLCDECADLFLSYEIGEQSTRTSLFLLATRTPGTIILCRERDRETFQVFVVNRIVGKAEDISDVLRKEGRKR